MSEYKRGWLFTFVFYCLGFVIYLIASPEATANGEWLMAAFILTVPALLLAFVVNGVVGILMADSAKKRKPPEGYASDKIPPPPSDDVKRKWEISSRERDCYCRIWGTNPAHLEKQGLAKGFCGSCLRCGEPGHTRHFPGPVPFTGAWCDKCYRVLKWTWPFRSVMGWFYLAAVVGMLWAIAYPIISSLKR